VENRPVRNETRVLRKDAKGIALQKDKKAVKEVRKI
jgi:hypothetical protein